MDGRAHRRLDAVSLPFHQLAAPLAVLLIGALLRIPLLARDSRFQPDEALYATFGRSVSNGDLLLSGETLDKPPLLFWAIGGSFRLFGISEFAARLPDWAASVVSVGVLFALARRLYADQRIALVAALLLAVSPFDRAFAGTAYTDPLLTLGVLCGCLASVMGRWRLAGFALAFAFATKPSGLQWIPLVILLGWVCSGLSICALRRFMLTFGIGFVMLALWSAARGTVPDFWTLNVVNNTPGRLIRANEVLPRFERWGSLLGTLAPLPILGWLAVPLTAFSRNQQVELSRHLLIDVLLTAYTIASLAALWLIAFNTYDRYLHTLAPFMLILLARMIVAVCALFKHPTAYRVALALTCFSPLLTSGAVIGGDPEEYTGIDRVASVLDALPVGTIVYDHWLGWELRFYLGDKPPIRVIWMPNVDEMISAVQSGYLVAPRSEADPWLAALKKAGVSVNISDETPTFIIAQVTR